MFSSVWEVLQGVTVASPGSLVGCGCYKLGHSQKCVLVSRIHSSSGYRGIGLGIRIFLPCPPPSSGGMELCITVFNPHVVVNDIYSAVLEIYSCEPLVLIPVRQKLIIAVQVHSSLSFANRFFVSSIRYPCRRQSGPIKNFTSRYL